MNRENTFEHPDFAFPQTVIANADVVMSKAMEKGDGMLALRAAIQTGLANVSIDQDRFNEAMGLVDSISNKFGNPVAPLCWLLEAQAYKDLYESDSWQFDRRKLPLDNYPENPKEWSGDLFKQRIIGLCRQALDGISSLNFPITKLEGIISTDDKAFDVNAYPTAACFVQLRVADILQSIKSTDIVLPFGNPSQPTLAQQASALYDEAIDGMIADCTASGNLFAAAYATTMKAEGMGGFAQEYLKKEYAKYADSEGVILILNAIGSYTSAGDKYAKELYALLQENIDKFHDSKYIGLLANLCTKLEDKSGSINLRERNVSGESIKASVSCTNINKLYLLVYKIPNNFDGETNSDVIRVGKLVLTVPVDVEGEVPFVESTEVELPNLDYGKYAIIVSYGPTIAGVLDKDYRYTSFVVSDLAAVSSFNEYGKPCFFIMDARNGKPMPHLELKYRENGKRNAPWLPGKTNDLGQFIVPNLGGYEIKIDSKFGTLNANMWEGRRTSERERTYHANIFTDLALYHPGDTVQFAAVVFSELDRKLNIAENKAITATAYDVNGKEIYDEELTTDNTGRAIGSFQLPKDGVLGYYTIRLSTPEVRYLATAEVQVAEYKSPTFFVEISKPEGEIKPDSPADFTGMVKTYSGMPLADCKIDYVVEYQNWWWRFGRSNASYGGSVTSDALGNFVISLPLEKLKDTPFEHGNFTVRATATAPSGEMQTSEPIRFSVGKDYRFNVPSQIAKEVKAEDLSLQIEVVDALNEGVAKNVDYQLEDESGKILASGNFVSPSLEIKVADIPSGKYKLTGYMTDNPDVKFGTELILYRADDNKAPYATPLWTPIKSVTAKAGEKNVEIPIASGYANSWILVQVANSDHMISTDWYQSDNKMVKVKVPVPAANERLFVTCIGVHNLDSDTEVIKVLPASADDCLKIETLSFRDKITPNQQETWTFKFIPVGATPTFTPALAVLSNKALNAIEPFEWRFNPQGILNWYPLYSSNFLTSPGWSRDSFSIPGPRQVAAYLPMEPNWNFYGQDWGCNYQRISVYKYQLSMSSVSAPTARNAVMKSAVDSDMMVESKVAVEMEADSVADEANTKGTAGSDDSSKEQLRPAEMPLAFFKPDLLSDSKGVLDISFEVPNFNTTWQLQLIGYDSRMQSASLTLDAIASKPVMVQMNLPRFLRVGDSDILCATFFNNTDAETEISGRFEIFNPVSGEIIASKQVEPRMTAASQSFVESIQLDGIADLQVIGVRAYATSGNYTDGEQSLVGILLSESLVIESQPFYVGGDANEAEITLPAYPKDADVTLQFCNNPVWLCVTALPAISDTDSESVLKQVEALFANNLALALTKKNPSLLKAIEYWETHDDGSLVSNLAKNEELKTLSLSQTTFVGDAEAETLRMSNLKSLLDPESANEVVNSLTQKIIDTQHYDGGWSWCPDWESSPWITGRLLLNFAMMRKFDALSIPMDVVEEAIRFCDIEIYKSYQKYKTYSVNGLMNYFYIRSFFPEVAISIRGFDSLKAEVLKDVRNCWRQFDIYDAATAATLLWRSNYQTEAREILESLRQRATVTPSRGMSFANIRSGYDAFPRLITTVQALEAFADIAPDAKEIDLIRQWLIIQRQTQDWGKIPYTAEVITAILTTGADWAQQRSDATITLDDKPIAFPASNPYIGEWNLTLTPLEASNAVLKVALPEGETKSPAWGAVLSRYMKPMQEVKEVGIDDLNVRKQIFKVVDDENGTRLTEPTDLKVGDRVRITLTITSARDLDYVAVTDERGACMNPEEQRSGYGFIDGCPLYKEVRNSQTNLFINFLSKGSHVFTYDCFVTQEGDFSSGIATAQSQYAPAITAHSGGRLLDVNR